MQRLTQLVARQDSDLDEIAKVIAKVITKDAGLTVRLLRAADPHANGPDEYDAITVEDALMRTGCVPLLAMGTPLTLALTKTFQTMLGFELESVDPHSVDPFPGKHVPGAIGFSGSAEGQVLLRMSVSGGREMAGENPRHPAAGNHQ